MAVAHGVVKKGWFAGLIFRHAVYSALNHTVAADSTHSGLWFYPNYPG
jgi:hypothetical protein